MTRSLRALAFLLAVTVPLLLNIPMPPAVTEPNMFAAVAGWGVVLLVLPRPEAGRRLLRIGRLPVAALGLCALACAWSLFRGTEGTDPALCTLALLGMSALLLCHGAGAGLRALPETFLPLAAALVVAGLGETVVGAFQVFAPRSTVGSLWASPSMWYPRAAANIGQPNHVADTLVWALAALVPLAEAARARRWRGATLVSAVVAVVLAGGIVLTNSRTGLLGVLMVAGWGALDRGLAGRHRLGMLALPLVTAVLWFLLSRWAATHHVSFSLVARDPRADISSFRFAIWRGALTLVAQNPWTGVGWGGFNFAWTLSPLGPRPAGYTDNAHDLLLHLAVELGVPAALLIVGLL
ncbi:MAG TPA: O-antigen ligase family protein, partial [Burkholderiaceae bacterium]